jgi:phospholipid/cholesterol/gamma-HCH transport system substrate-binding protein
MPRTRSVAWSELKLGIIGIVAAVLIVVVVVAVGGQGGFFWQRYPLKTTFLDAQGLKPGAVVRLSGKDVGRVTSVEFVDGAIEVAFDVSKNVRPLITDRSVTKVGSVSLLGDSILDVKAGREGTPIADWGYVKSQEGGMLGDLTSSATESLKKAGDLLADARAGKGTIGKLFTDDALYRDLQQFVAAAGDLANKLNTGGGTMGRLVNDPAVWNSLKASLENLQATTAKLNGNQAALGRFLNDEAMGKSLAGTISYLEQTTARLNRNDNTVGKLLTEKELYDRLNSVTAKVDTLVTTLNTNEGTVGRLLHDQALYENMNRTITELRDLVAAIRKDPKKYLQFKFSIW